MLSRATRSREWPQPRAPSRSRPPPSPPLHAWVENPVEDIGKEIGNDDGDGEHDDDRDRTGEIATLDRVVCVGSDTGPLEDRFNHDGTGEERPCRDPENRRSEERRVGKECRSRWSTEKVKERKIDYRL